MLKYSHVARNKLGYKMKNSTNEVKNHKTQSTETAYIYILSHISNTLVKGETAVCPISREKTTLGNTN